MNTAVEKEVDPREEERKRVLADAQVVLKEYGMQESNIPINHGYWDMMNQFRALSKNPFGVEVEETTDDKIKGIIKLASSDSASATKAYEAIRMALDEGVTVTTPGPPEADIAESASTEEPRHSLFHHDKEEKKGKK